MKSVAKCRIVSHGLLLLLCMGASPRAVPLMRDPFAGAWSVVVTPDEDARHEHQRDAKDTLTFRGNLFSSKLFAEKGFKETKYEEDVRMGGVAQFSATATSEKEGKAKWTGRVVVDQIEGDLVWTKPDGTVLNFAFKGTKG